MHAAFLEANEVSTKRCKASGTTATLAVAVGWELLVASVGDSLAFVDTGSEVIQVSTSVKSICQAAKACAPQAPRNLPSDEQPLPNSMPADRQQGKPTL